MTVTKVSGVKKFKKGMCFKHTYRWQGEPSKTYYLKLKKPEKGGTRAYAEIYRTDTDGKKDKYPRSVRETFIHTFETQIGRINNPSGSGRMVKIKCK